MGGWSCRLVILAAPPGYFQANVEAFRYSAPTAFSERDYEVFEALLGAKLVTNNVLIKLVVPKKKKKKSLNKRLGEILPRKYLPYKGRGCVKPVMGLAEVVSVGYRVRKDVLIANPEKFGAIGKMSPPRREVDLQRILGKINHGTNSL